MLVKEFDYYLPDELIARYPAPERDASRLMVLDRSSSSITGSVFNRLTDYLNPGDLLVMNDTRVIPARIYGRKATGGRVEVFLVRRQDGAAEKWTCLMKSSKGMKPGDRITLDGAMEATVCHRLADGAVVVEFCGDTPFAEWLERAGRMPLPPYLQREADGMDRERYQTVYASVPGAVAAPTAGLHFTGELLGALGRKGVGLARITLHTGLGTFLPVRAERVEEHRIHTESYSVSEEVSELIASVKGSGGRVVAVGTTTARTLEYAADEQGRVRPGAGDADIFIYPGYRFRVVDALITNFHLPESTLIMLVSAFAGKEFVFEAYRRAVAERYRFYSYGDAMLIY